MSGVFVRKIIVANWKMHKTFAEAEGYMKILLRGLQPCLECRVLIAPSFPLLSSMVQWAKGSSIEIGAQNIHDQESGAFTGEVSAKLVKETGSSFVLVGHSERRQLFGEEGSFISRKLKRALATSLQPILCIGETLEERDLGKTKEVLQEQLFQALQGFSEEEILQIGIAYEPVWAIGTGKQATPEIAQEAHSFCRSQLASKWGEMVACRIPILYGGSVKSDNMTALMRQKDIDGVLVGGASLDPESFLQIIQYK